MVATTFIHYGTFRCIYIVVTYASTTIAPLASHRSTLGLRQVVLVLRCRHQVLLTLSPNLAFRPLAFRQERSLLHCFFIQHNLVASVAISSHTYFVYSNNSGLHRHLLPRCTPQLSPRPSLLVPYTLAYGWGPLSSTSSIGNTSSCLHNPMHNSSMADAFVLDAFQGLVTRRTLCLWWLDCISFSTDLLVLVQTSSLPRLHHYFSFTSLTTLTMSTLASPPSMGVDQAIHTCL